jgi:hypothetical protein
MQTCGERCGENTDKRPFRMDCRIKPGNDEMKVLLAARSAPEFYQTP